MADSAKDAIFAFSGYTRLDGGVHKMSLAGASKNYVPIVEAGEVDLVGWEAYATGAGAESSPLASWAADDTIEGVSTALDLYPKLQYGFWVTLDTTGGGVLPSIFVQNAGDGTGVVSQDLLPTEKSLAGASYDPSTDSFAEGYRGWRLGYVLEGWYTDPECTAKVEGDLTISVDTTLYAKWTPRSDTPYTVMHLIEDGSGTSCEGAFEVFGTVLCTGTTGMAAQPVDDGGPTTTKYHRATAEETAAHEALRQGINETVSGDGSTVVKVYWPRNVYTYVFKDTDNKTTIQTTGWVKWGQDSSTWASAALINKSASTSTYAYNYERKTSTGNSWWHLGEEAPFPNGVMGNKLTVSYKRFKETYSCTRWSRAYHNVLPGETPTNPTKDVTLGGITYTFELTNPDGAFRSGYTGVTASTVPRTAEGVAVWTAGLIYMGSSRYTTTIKDLTSATNYGSYKCEGYLENGIYCIDYLCIRNSFDLSFANVEGVVGSYGSTATREVAYNASLSSNDPGYTSETVRMVGGQSQRFAGWYTDDYAAHHPNEPESAASAIDLSSAKMPGGSTTLYAAWVSNSYNVTFDARGGTFVDPPSGTPSEDGSKLVLSDVPSGTLIARPPDPIRQVGSVEYTFSGWYKDPDYRTPCNFYTDAVGTQDVTLYAKWVKGGFYNVTYHKSDGTEIAHVDDTTYRYGATVTVAGQQEDASQTQPFMGWSLVRGNASRIVGQSFVISSNTDLFAVYGNSLPDALPSDVEDGAPSVTLDANYANLPEGSMPLTDGVTTTLQATRANASVTLPSQLTATVGDSSVTAAASACHLVGWSATPEGPVEFGLGEAVAVASDTTLYAKWATNQLSAGALADRTYNGAAQEATPAVRDAADDAVLALDTDYDLAWADNVNVGTATVTVSGRGNYALSEPVTVQFQITRARVTIAADDKSSTYGDEPVPLTWRVASGAIYGDDDLGVTLDCNVGAASPAGTYQISVGTLFSADYEITTVAGTYTVVPATEVSVDVSGYSGTYDGAAHGITVTPNPRGTTTVTVYYALTELTAENYASVGSTNPDDARASHAGDTRVWWWLVATGDQEDSKGGSAVVSIAPAPLVCRANDASVAYGDDAAPAGVTWSGFAGDDDASSIGTDALTYAFSSRDDGSGAAYSASSPRGTYYIIPSGATSSDYDIAYEAGVLQVTPRSVGLSWSSANPAYTGETRHYAGATLTGVLAADAGQVSIGGYVGTTSATDAGSYAVSVASLTGERARNYALPENSHTWSVAQAENSATVAIDSWTYGGATNLPLVTAGFGASSAHITWSKSADGPFSDELPTGAGGTYPDAGTYYVRAQIDEDPNWAAATSRPTRFEISPRPLTLAVDDKSVAFGDPAPTYTATWSGFAAGEDEVSSGFVTGALDLHCSYAPGSHVGDYPVYPRGLGSSGNYALTVDQGVLKVAQAENAWTTEPAATSKTYDGEAVVASAPAALFSSAGEPVVEYSRAGSDAWSTTAPTDAGSYVMRATVAETVNYAGLSTEVPFEVARATWPDIPAASLSTTESRVRHREGSPAEDTCQGTVTISGHDASVPTEWSADGGATWSSVPASGVIEGLAAGDVLVRHAADDNHVESAATQVEVTYGVSGSVRWSYEYLYPQKDPVTGETTMVSGTVNDTPTERSRAANLYLFADGSDDPVEGYPVAVSSAPDGAAAAVGSYELHGLSSHATYALGLRPTVDESPESAAQVESASFVAAQSGDDFAVSFAPVTGFFDGDWEVRLAGADTDGHTAVQAVYVKVLWAPDDDSPDDDYAVVSQQASGAGTRCAVVGEGSSRAASGSLPVWLYNSTGIPSRYRARVVGYVVDGAEFPCSQVLWSAGAPAPMHWDDAEGGPVRAPMVVSVDNLSVPMVALDANGGEAPVAGDYLLGHASGGTYLVSRSDVEAREPSWDHHRFDGWFWGVAPTSGDKLSADVTGLSGKATLYAHWTEQQDAPSTLSATAPTPVLEGADGHVARDASGAPITNSDGSITGVTDGMEWRRRGDGGVWPDSWQAVPTGATSVTGLSVGTYQVRYAAVAATDAAWPKDASEAAEVSVAAKGIAPAPASPAIEGVEPTSVQITAQPGLAYSIDGGASWVEPAPGETIVDFGGLTPGKPVSIVARAVETDALYHSDASASTEVTLPKLDIVLTDPPEPVQATYDGQKHSLVISPSALPDGCVGMECSIDGSEWSGDVPQETHAGTFYVNVRFVGDDTHADLVLDTPLECVIAQAGNEWVTSPAISSWTYGLPASDPVGDARYGEVSFAYAAVGLGGQAEGELVFETERPSVPGSYLLLASVPEDMDWTGLEELVPFDIFADSLTLEPNSRLASGSTPSPEGAVGESVTVPACGFTWAHHDFIGWNTASDGSGEAYAPGSPYELTAGEDVLFAQWDPRGELSYDGNGATAGSTEPQPGHEGEHVLVSASGFARDGFEFVGWNTRPDGSGVAYAPGDAFELALGGDVLFAQWSEVPEPTPAGVPMYRLYNPYSGEHFYTASAYERDAVDEAGWNYEGVGWVAPSTDGEPVYRLYNPNAGDHHYTMSAGERDVLVGVGWSYEGVGWLSDPHEAVPVWREYNPFATSGAHNFTTSEAEHVHLCTIGWRGEGIAWYGV
ncbi:InlB B-repeat-containing protein [Olsenella intestinalis]|uniref:InlB B-repeat-containing protein n=1 Tax=Olsenella intestinalis TaxID=2930083 RepID=UPI00200BC3AC|nr:InlB B-repeat-containing protein [Olsenella intestinalis]